MNEKRLQQQTQTLQDFLFLPLLLFLEVSSRVSMSMDPMFSKVMVSCCNSPLKSWTDTELGSSSLDVAWELWVDLIQNGQRQKCDPRLSFRSQFNLWYPPQKSKEGSKSSCLIKVLAERLCFPKIEKKLYSSSEAVKHGGGSIMVLLGPELVTLVFVG